VGVLAGLIDVEGVMGVLYGRDSHAPGGKARDQLREQGRFPGSAPAGDADDAHARHYIGIRAPAEIVAETRRGTRGNSASIATIGPY
jgi:hypothetical protein